MTRLLRIVDAYLGMPKELRQKFLHDHWGFNCTCAFCRAPEAETAASDARRFSIVDVRDAIKEARKEGHFDKALDLSNRLLSLYEQEEMEPLIPDFHEALANLHLDLEDIDAAEKHARLALEGHLRFYSPDNAQIEKIQQLLDSLA